MHHQSRRLVEHQHMFVFVHDVQRDRLRREGQGLRGRPQRDLQALSGTHASRRAGGSHAIERDMPLSDHVLQVAARKFAGQHGQRLVDALLVVCGIEQPLAPLGLERVRLAWRIVIAVERIEHSGVGAGLRH
jgi:hypothetical protein